MKKFIIALAFVVGACATPAVAQETVQGSPYMTAYFVCRTPDAIITLLSQSKDTFSETTNELMATEQCAARETGWSVMLIGKWTEVTSPNDGVTYEVWEVVDRMGNIAYSHVSKKVKLGTGA